MSLFKQLSDADKTCTCCNKVAMEYHQRYMREKMAEEKPDTATQAKQDEKHRAESKPE